MQSIDSQLDLLLSLDDESEQRDWLTKEYPRPDEQFASAMRQACISASWKNPHEAEKLVRVLSLAADCWQDAATAALYLHTAADIQEKMGDPQAAHKLYQQASDQYQTLNMPHKMVQVAVGHIGALRYLGRTDDALALGETAIAQAQQLGDALSEGKILTNLGNIYGALARFEQSKKCYENAQLAYQKLADVPANLLAALNFNYAIALAHLDDFDEAIERYEAAQYALEQLGMTLVIAQIDTSLLELYMAQGDYQRALQAGIKARDAYVSIDNIDTSHTATAALNLSKVHLTLNLWDEALVYAEEAGETFARMGMSWYQGQTHLYRAIILVRLLQFEEASTHLGLARDSFITCDSVTWAAICDLHRGSLLIRQGQYDAAAKLVTAAQETFSDLHFPSYAVRAQLLMGEIAYLQGDYETADQQYRAAMSQLEEIGFSALRHACYEGFAHTAKARGHVDQACALFTKAINDIERLQSNIGTEAHKLSFLQDKRDVYQEIVQLLLSIDTDAALHQAFDMAERSRARVLLDVMTHATPPGREISDADPLVTQLAQTRRELSWYYSRLLSPDTDAPERQPDDMARLKAEIAQRETAVDGLLDQLNTPESAAASYNLVWTASAVQLIDVLPDDAILIEYYIIDETIIAFLLTKDGLQKIPLTATVQQVQQLLGQWRLQLNKFGYGKSYLAQFHDMLLATSQDVLAQLYDGLLRPILERIDAADYENLFIIPHGIIHYLPLNALFDGTQYMIDLFAVSIAPSGTILYQSLAAESHQVEGDPVIIGLADDTVPHTEAETEAIAALFDNPALHIGVDATLDKLNFQTRHTLLHLATHALFRTDNPAFSALKLADGWFTVNDIYSIVLSPALIVLSGCETGRHQMAAGDELVGLSRGFFASGAKSLVVSLWMVDDLSTAELMTVFYSFLNNGHTVSHALRQAQLTMKQKRDHPFYWAPFLLSGDSYLRLTV